MSKVTLVDSVFDADSEYDITLNGKLKLMEKIAKFNPKCHHFVATKQNLKKSHIYFCSSLSRK